MIDPIIHSVKPIRSGVGVTTDPGQGKEQRAKAWYYGRLIEDYCPICDTPMPFPFGCVRCGWTREDDEAEKVKEQEQGE
jgi:hypothetical protein